MVIILSGDFSSKKIETIKIEKVLSAETLDTLNNYGRTLTDLQRFAYQDFINTLKTDGIYDKIHNLYFPILASSPTEAMFNIKKNQSDAPIDITHWNIGAANGLIATEITSFVDSQKFLMELNACSTKNVHFLLRNMSAFGAGSYYMGAYVATEPRFNMYLFDSGTDHDLACRMSTSVHNTATGGSYTKTTNFQGFSSLTSNILALAGGTVYSQAAFPHGDNAYSGENVSLLLYNGASSQNNQAEVGIISQGLGLTQAELESFLDAETILMSTFGIS